MTINLLQGSNHNFPNSLDQKAKWAGLYRDITFRIAVALTLDLLELQVVESIVKKRKKNESWIEQEKTESCKHNSLSSKASETREFGNLSSPQILGV